MTSYICPPPKVYIRGFYVGPLGPNKAKKTLTGKVNGKFRTAAAAAWPDQMCEAFAQAIVEHCIETKVPAEGAAMQERPVATTVGSISSPSSSTGTPAAASRSTPISSRVSHVRAGGPCPGDGCAPPPSFNFNTHHATESNGR